MIASVRPYPCQCHNSIRRWCPAGDHKAGLMSVNAKDVRCWIMGLHKWLLGICGPKQKNPKWVISEKADFVLGEKWFVSTLQLLHWRSCYVTTEINGAILSRRREGIQNRHQISDSFLICFDVLSFDSWKFDSKGPWVIIKAKPLIRTRAPSHCNHIRQQSTDRVIKLDYMGTSWMWLV